MKSRKVLITGCPKSGTQFWSAVFQGMHLDVKHESMGDVGCSSFAFVVDEARRTEPPRFQSNHGFLSDYHFEHLIVTVRHPLHTIRSIAWHLPPVWFNWPCRFFPPRVRAPRYMDSGFPPIPRPSADGLQRNPEHWEHWVQFVAGFWYRWNMMALYDYPPGISDNRYVQKIEEVLPNWNGYIKEKFRGLLPGSSVAPTHLDEFKKDTDYEDISGEVTWETLGPWAEKVRELALKVRYTEEELG